MKISHSFIRIYGIYTKHMKEDITLILCKDKRKILEKSTILMTIFFLFYMHIPVNGKNDYKMEKWVKLENEVLDTGFSDTFIDSLRKQHAVKAQKNLRDNSCFLFSKKEKFVYEVGWGPLNAGFGIMNLDKVKSNGNIQVSFKGVSNNFVSAFYTLRDYFRSTIEPNGLYPLFYEEHLSEGKYRDKRWVLYDHINKKVHTNKRNHEIVEVPPFTGDILSLLFMIRNQKLVKGQTFKINCFVHKKMYPVKFKCTARKKIKVKAGVFNAICVEPSMVGNGRNFTWKDRLQIWFTDDQYHIPVKIKAKVKIGSLIGELIYYKKYLYDKKYNYLNTH